MKKCYIVGAAPCENITPPPTSDDFIIAADGGYATLTRLGITPDLTVGDFDSLGFVPQVKNINIQPTAKDYTDLSIAAEHAVKLGYKELLIYGALGGDRFEHTLANLQIASWLEKQGVHARLFGMGYAAEVLINRRLEFDGSEKGFISVFASGTEAKGVTIKGLKFPLNNFTLSPEMPIGISNEFLGVPAFVEVKDGKLIIIWQI